MGAGAAGWGSLRFNRAKKVSRENDPSGHQSHGHSHGHGHGAGADPERRRRARQAQRKRGILTSARSFSLAWPLKHDRSGCGAKRAAAPPAAGLRQRADSLLAGVTDRLAQLVKRFVLP